MAKTSDRLQLVLFGDEHTGRRGEDGLLLPEVRSEAETPEGITLRQKVVNAFIAATDSGRQAMAASYQHLRECEADDPRARRELAGCGGALIHLQVDGRTGLGKALRGFIDQPHPHFPVVRSEFGYTVHLPFGGGQAFGPRWAAAYAAEKIIEDQLGIDVMVQTYLD